MPLNNLLFNLYQACNNKCKGINVSTVLLAFTRLAHHCKLKEISKQIILVEVFHFKNIFPLRTWNSVTHVYSPCC